MENSVTSGKQFQYLQWFLLIVIVFVLVKILYKFFGPDQDEKGADEFANNPLGSGNTTEVPQSIVKNIAAVQKKSPENVTKDDIKSLMPSSTVFLNWLNRLKDASGFDDDEEAVYQVFREMKNQVSFYGFSQFFSVYMKKNLTDWLSDFLDDGELSKINSIIKKLPKT